MNGVLSVVVPTLAGREESLARCLASLERTVPGAEVIVVKGRPACGIAWNEGASSAHGEFICFAADDLEFKSGWWPAARGMLALGILPAPYITWPDGRAQYSGAAADIALPDGTPTEFTRVPVLPMMWWRSYVAPMLPIHYFTDNYVSHRMKKAGVETQVCVGYTMHHHAVNVGTEDWMERIAADREVYQAAIT